MGKINLNQKFNRFSEHWTPKILGELNDQYLKIAKVKGEFVWHDHANEDELFMVIKGQLNIQLKGEIVVLNEGEIYIVPKGVRHKPFAEDECWILLLEPKETKHTGAIKDDLTVEENDWL